MDPARKELLPPSLRSRPVAQVGILVPDLRAGMRTWGTLLGEDDWLVYTYGPGTVRDLTYRGAAAGFSMRVALAGTGPQVELIEPLRGPSIYHEWLQEHGHGLHHLGFHVDSIAGAIEDFRAGGIPLLQSGRGYGLDGDGGFAYFDTQDTVGVIVEAIEVPKRRRPSEDLAN